jgi:molybdate transport system substrate-binding protein
MQSNLTPDGTAADSGALRVFCTNSMQGVLSRLIPQFERESGIPVSVSFYSSVKSKARIASGETADVYIFNTDLMNDLEKQNKVQAGSRRDLARCGVGVAVRAGAPKPDIASVEAFRRTLTDAKSIAYATVGNSGIHFADVVERLGMTPLVVAKARTRPDGLIGDFLTKGEAEIAVQQIPELMAVPGIDIVGPLPRELQKYSLKAICVVATSKQQEKAKALIEFLTGAAAARVFEANGHESMAGKA